MVFLDVFSVYLCFFFCNPGTNLVITVMFTSSFYPMEGPMFCDVPRSNLHFLKNGGFQRNNTFKNVSYI